MNIFVTDSCPQLSAKALDDKRVIKMILETAQMLSTVIRFFDENYANTKGLYRKTHSGHPCVKWASRSKANYLWLLDHMDALLKEYTVRFGKQHKSGDLFQALSDFAPRLRDEGLTPFANCTDFKHIINVHDAYKHALMSKWEKDRYQPRWTKAKRPEWALG